MKRALIVTAALALVGCAKNATQDLPLNQQSFITTPMVVYISPDQFPNVGFRCIGKTGVYLTTRVADAIEVVPNDKNCPEVPG